MEFWPAATVQRRSKPDHNDISSSVALFSGPHGTSAPVGNYETILMIADGFSIVTQLPYLKHLIYG
jgi:NAD(P)H-flavin reductase